MRKKLLGVSVLVLLLSLMIVPLAQAQQITLKFACWDYELNGYDKTLIEEFEKANPDIKVEVYDTRFRVP